MSLSIRGRPPLRQLILLSGVPLSSTPKPVPLFELATQWQLIRNDVEAAVKEVLD